MTRNPADEKYMERCIQLASWGWEQTSPNPMVGCVIVHKNRIVAEGYHSTFGEDHAEVMAINKLRDKSLLNQCTLYVNLEPCSHQGKTPSCALRIIKEGIPNVVVGSVDPFAKVAGKGIALLKNAGIDVRLGVLEEKCMELNSAFFVNTHNKRPYIILKWATSRDGFIGRNQGNQIKISDRWADILSHQLRARSDAIIIGRNTLINDDPMLSTRLFPGRSPRPVILIREEDEFKDLGLIKNPSSIRYLYGNRTSENSVSIEVLLKDLIEKEIGILLVEGGSKLLRSFIKSDMWDEAHCITSQIDLVEGVQAPRLNDDNLADVFMIGDDEVRVYKKSPNNRAL